MRISRVIPLVLIGAVGGPAAGASRHSPTVIALPDRWRTGAAIDGDRSGDLRTEAISLIDEIGRRQRPATSALYRAGRFRAFSPSQTIRVWRRAVDGSTASCEGRVDVIPFEQYVKGVLPHEWFSSWRPAALQAGAVAIRTYAAWWVDAGGKYTCADVDDTTASQVYRDETHPATSAAVDATEGMYVVDEAGDLVFAEYSAENSDPTEFGVDEPYCTGRERNGHGRGVCQWGTQRWALNEDRGFDWIVTHYYPGSAILDSTPPLPVDAGPVDAAPVGPDAGTGGIDVDAGGSQGGGGGGCGGCTTAGQGGASAAGCAILVLGALATGRIARRRRRLGVR